MGAEIVKEVANKTNDTVGDGTTLSSVVLFEALSGRRSRTCDSRRERDEHPKRNGKSEDRRARRIKKDGEAGLRERQK